MVLLLALLAAPRAAGAWGFEAGRTGAGLRLGVVYPTATNSFDRIVRSGYAGGLRGFWYPWDWFALGLELDATLLRRGTVFRTAPDSPGVRFSAEAGSALVTGRVNLLVDRPWTVFVLGGGGAHRFTIKPKGEPGATQTFKRSHTGMTVAAGAGAEAFFMKNMSTFFEARFQEFRLKREDVVLESAEGLSFQAGLHYWFRVD